MTACEPAGSNREWFRFRKKATGSWYERFCYDRVYLARSSMTISVKTNCLFWHLVKIGFPLENMPGYLQAGGDKKAKWLTNEYLAKGLRCCPRTVGRGLKRLTELRLISIDRRGRHKFFVGIRPLTHNASLWRESWKNVIVDDGPVTVQSLFGLPSSAELIPDLREDLATTKYLLAFRVSGKVGQECVTKILKHQIDEGVWKQLLSEAIKIHARNHASDPKTYPKDNCGSLFKSMLDSRIKQDAARSELKGYDHIQGHDEMKVWDLVRDYRVEKAIETLLNQAVKEECLPLRDSEDLVPCRIHWDGVVACAKKAGKEWKAFQRLFAEQIFDLSGDPPASDWYDAWMALEQIPDWDQSPMKVLGLDDKAKRLVRFEAERIAKKVYNEDDTVPFRHLVNNLIRLGCWQAQYKSSSSVEGTINELGRLLTRKSVANSTGCVDNLNEGEEWLTEAEEQSLVG